MKKLILVTLLAFSSMMNSQDFTLQDFKTKKITQTTTDSEYFKQFLEKNNWFDAKSIENNIDLHELVNPDDLIIVCKVKNVVKYNLFCISLNKKNNTFVSYYLNKTKDQIQLADSKETAIFTSLNNDGKVKIVNEVGLRITCFRACMNDAEERIADDAVGWLAWEYSLGLPIMTAYYCSKLCNPRITY